MPHIDINGYPGRSAELKKEIAEKVIKFLNEEIKIPVEALSVSFTDIEPEKFAEVIKNKINPKDVVISSKFIE